MWKVEDVWALKRLIEQVSSEGLSANEAYRELIVPALKRLEEVATSEAARDAVGCVRPELRELEPDTVLGAASQTEFEALLDCIVKFYLWLSPQGADRERVIRAIVRAVVARQRLHLIVPGEKERVAIEGVSLSLKGRELEVRYGDGIARISVMLEDVIDVM